MNGIQMDMVEQRGLDIMIVRLEGDIDMANAQHVLAEILAAVPNNIGALVVDTSEVTYLDSNGVRLLFELARGMQRRRKQFRVVVPAAAFHRKVLFIAELPEVVPVDDSVDQSFARLGQAQVGYDEK